MKILFIHNELRTFVKMDLEILQSLHEVRVIKFSPGKAYLTEVIQGVEWCDLVFGWWATWHMVLPAYLAQRKGKPVVVVGGDYDIIFEKEYRSRKRLLLDKLRNGLGYFLFPLIDHYIVNSDFSKTQAEKLPYIKKGKVARVYHGFDDVNISNSDKNAKLVLTVGSIHQYDIYRKGYKTFVQSAAYLPGYQFVLAGSWKDKSIDVLRSWNDKNVLYPGFLSEEKLQEFMRDAKVYVQASLHEGFGMAMAEAMLFRCIPVVTRRGAIPEVVGDCGLYVPYDDPEKTAEAIAQASASGGDLGIKARERILSLFPIENRKAQLFEIVEEAFANKR